MDSNPKLWLHKNLTSMKSNYSYSHSLSYPDNGGTNFLRNIGKFLPDYTTKNPKRGFYPVTSVRTYVTSAQENAFVRFRKQMKCLFILFVVRLTKAP